MSSTKDDVFTIEARITMTHVRQVSISLSLPVSGDSVLKDIAFACHVYGAITSRIIDEESR
jgi:hypothetical protein